MEESPFFGIPPNSPLQPQRTTFSIPVPIPHPCTIHTGSTPLRRGSSDFKAFGPLSLHCVASTSEYFLVNTDYYSEKLLTYFYAYKNVCLLILTQQMTTPCQGWECEQEVGRVS